MSEISVVREKAAKPAVEDMIGNEVIDKPALSPLVGMIHIQSIALLLENRTINVSVMQEYWLCLFGVRRDMQQPLTEWTCQVN